MGKFKVFLLFLIFAFIGCSTQSTLQNRIPASFSQCDKYYLPYNKEVFPREKHLVDHFFLKKPGVINHVNYAINFERVEYYVKQLPNKYPNELSVVKMGTYDGIDLQRINIPGWGNGDRKQVIITAGVHGNESAGVATAINILEKIIYNPAMRNNYDFVIIPFMNPGGLSQNTRRLKNNVDLNRTFPGGKSKSQGATNIIKSSLKGETFDLALDLHEAPFRDKFFVIKMQENDQQLTRKVLAEIPEEFLVTAKDSIYPGKMYRAAIPGGPQIEQIPKNISYKLFAPGEVSSSNMGTVKTYLAQTHSANFSYTLEAPGQFELVKKVSIYTDIVEGYLKNFLTN